MNGRESKAPKKARGGRGADDSASLMNDDSDAVSSSSLTTKNADGEEMTFEDRLDEMVEQLAEKRASTRQVALTRLIDLLQTSVQYDFISGRLETLTMYILISVKKGDTPEVALATHALSLMAVTLGADADKLVSEAMPVLSEYMKNSAKSGAGRGAVAVAIGFINFLGSANDHDTLAALTLLSDLMKQPNLPEPLAVGAWESFGLLASTLPTHKIAGELMTTYLPQLMKFLDDESIDVKTAVGECIALMWEAKQAVDAEAKENGEDEDEIADEEHNLEEELDALAPLPEAAIPTPSPPPVATDESKMTDVDPAASSSSSASLNAFSDATRSPAILPRRRPHAKKLKYPSASQVQQVTTATIEQQLIERFSALAKDSGRYQSKKARATQKKNFREFLRTVEDGDTPEESLKIEKSKHSFSGWSHIMQLDAIRDIIGKGLNTHFVHNEVLREIFDLYIEAGLGVDDPNRKAASRAESAARARENAETRAKARQKKTALANSFGLE